MAFHPPPPDIRALLVGDEGVGKTCLALALMGEPFSAEYLPSVAASWEHSFQRQQAGAAAQQVCLQLTDSVMRQDGERLWSLHLPHSHLFVCCFSLAHRSYSCDHPSSPIDGLKSRWLPIIRRHSFAHVPHVLIGLKSDLRDADPDSLPTADPQSQPTLFTTPEQGAAFMEELKQEGHNFIGYFECSSLLGQGVKEAFQKIVELPLLSQPLLPSPPAPSSAQQQTQGCLML